jgi:leader peptidase (prepilin peptidase) / N-methyltransferase
VYAAPCVPILADFPAWFTAALAVSLGLALGSFLNVVIHRLPREQSLARPGSRCPACNTPIAPWNNLPILSWLALRGHARCCGARISPRYPLVEALGGAVAYAIHEVIILDLPRTTPAPEALGLFALYLALCLGLIAAIFIDLEFMILPDPITLGGTVLGLVSIPLRDIDWQSALFGAALGFLLVYVPFIVLYRIVRGQAGMGLGDAKLLMLAGAWFGWPGAVFALLAGSVQGTIVALAVLLTRGRIEEPPAVRAEREAMLEELALLEGSEREALERELALDPIAKAPEPGIGQARIAFGPFLCLAILEYLFLGPLLLQEMAWLVSGY